MHSSSSRIRVTRVERVKPRDERLFKLSILVVGASGMLVWDDGSRFAEILWLAAVGLLILRSLPAEPMTRTDLRGRQRVVATRKSDAPLQIALLLSLLAMVAGVRPEVEPYPELDVLRESHGIPGIDRALGARGIDLQAEMALDDDDFRAVLEGDADDGGFR